MTVVLWNYSENTFHSGIFTLRRFIPSCSTSKIHIPNAPLEKSASNTTSITRSSVVAVLIPLLSDSFGDLEGFKVYKMTLKTMCQLKP